MTRSLIREHLFKLLFRIEFNDPADMPEQVRLYFEDIFRESSLKLKTASISGKVFAESKMASFSARQ